MHKRLIVVCLSIEMVYVILVNLQIIDTVDLYFLKKGWKVVGIFTKKTYPLRTGWYVNSLRPSVNGNEIVLGLFLFVLQIAMTACFRTELHKCYDVKIVH